MEDHRTPDPALKFKPDYKWPELGIERNCPADTTIPGNSMKMILHIMVNPGGVLNANFNSLKKILCKGSSAQTAPLAKNHNSNSTH